MKGVEDFYTDQEFQTVDTDFSPGDFQCEGNISTYEFSFRPLTRISLLVTAVSFTNRFSINIFFRPLTRISLLVTFEQEFLLQPVAVAFQTVDTDFSPGDAADYGVNVTDSESFRPLTRISLLVTLSEVVL